VSGDSWVPESRRVLARTRSAERDHLSAQLLSVSRSTKATAVPSSVARFSTVRSRVDLPTPRRPSTSGEESLYSVKAPGWRRARRSPACGRRQRRRPQPGQTLRWSISWPAGPPPVLS